MGMDFFPISPPQDQVFPAHTTEQAPANGGLSQLLSHQPIEGDENSEWLSVFVEDCFSSPGNYLLAPANHKQLNTQASTTNPVETLKPQLLQHPRNPKKKTAQKARSIMKVKTHKIPSIFDLEHFIADLSPDPDPPLLQQAHWLADSEPIFPIKQEPLSKKDLCEEKQVDVALELSLSSEHYIEPITGKDKEESVKTQKVQPLPSREDTFMEARALGQRNTLQCLWRQVA